MTHKDLLYKIIEVLQQERSHEGTTAVISPTELLDKIMGISSEMQLQDVKDKIIGAG